MNFKENTPVVIKTPTSCVEGTLVRIAKNVSDELLLKVRTSDDKEDWYPQNLVFAVQPTSDEITADLKNVPKRSSRKKII